MTEVETVVAAARALMYAGRWELGAELLAATGGDHPELRLAAAELAVYRDFWCGTRTAPDALSAATADPRYEWEVDLLTLQHDYFSAIMGPEGEVRIGPERHDPSTVAELTGRGERVHAAGPPGAGRGWAAFWRGVIADNLAGEPATAKLLYAEGLAAAEAHGDDPLAAEALRHLGGHARREGDHAEARRLWERSTRLRQRAGMVPWTLSQQLALAQNAADTGEDVRAAAIAAEVGRWAGELRLSRLAAAARDLPVQ
jgi:hypothetical protein